MNKELYIAGYSRDGIQQECCISGEDFKEVLSEVREAALFSFEKECSWWVARQRGYKVLYTGYCKKEEWHSEELDALFQE